MGGDAASARERFPQHLFDDLAEPPPDVRLAERAAEAFPSRFQGMSAKTGLDEAQSRFVGRSAATLGILGLFAPGLILTGLGTLSLVIFVLIIAYRLALAIFGDSRAYLLTDPASLSLLLPVYTILIALKDEAACMPQLSDSLMSLEYPRHLLDVKLLLEAGDDATKDAIHAQI